MKITKITFLIISLLTSAIASESMFAQTAHFLPRDEEGDTTDAPSNGQQSIKKSSKIILKTKKNENKNRVKTVSSSNFESSRSSVASLDGKKVYQIDRRNNRIVITDSSNNKIGKKSVVSLDRTPIAVAVDSTSSIAYVITLPKEKETHGALYQVGLKDGEYQVLGIPTLLGKTPSAIAVSSNGKKVYVTHIDEPQDLKIMTAKGSLFIFSADKNPPELTLKSALGIEQNPIGIALAPNGKVVYLIEQEDKNNPSGVLAAVDTDSLKVVSHLAVGEDPYAVSVSPDGNFVYVAHSGKSQLAVVDVSSYPIQKIMDVSLKENKSPIVFGSFHDVPSSLMQ